MRDGGAGKAQGMRAGDDLMGEGGIGDGGMGLWVWGDDVGTPARAEPLRAWWAGLEGLLPTEDTRVLG